MRARAEADIVEREAIEVAEKLRDYNVVYSNEAEAVPSWPSSFSMESISTADFLGNLKVS